MLSEVTSSHSLYCLGSGLRRPHCSAAFRLLPGCPLPQERDRVLLGLQDPPRAGPGVGGALGPTPAAPLDLRLPESGWSQPGSGVWTHEQDTSLSTRTCPWAARSLCPWRLTGLVVHAMVIGCESPFSGDGPQPSKCMSSLVLEAEGQRNTLSVPRSGSQRLCSPMGPGPTLVFPLPGAMGSGGATSAASLLLQGPGTAAVTLLGHRLGA